MITKKHCIPFNSPHMTGKELTYIAESHTNGMLAGDGPFTQRCHDWLEKRTGASRALLTHSCTSALELTALLLNIKPGDEIIMPSYTFVSTANAFVLRGGIPVFVDIREDTLNIDENLIEAAITPNTKAIVVVHYAGVACEMDSIVAIALKHRLRIVEDAAQAIMSSYKGKPLGSIGDLSAFSFHETKNVISGEGGALIVNDPSLVMAAEIMREKGTDRSQFFRGQVDKYTWQSVGSSFLPGELTAAFLWAQLEEADSITQNRLMAWHYYHTLFLSLEAEGRIRRPIVPEKCDHNAHMYYILVNSPKEQVMLLNQLNTQGIGAVFHYIPLHSSPAGKLYGRVHGMMTITDSTASRLIRLPLWFGISTDQQRKVVEAITNLLKNE